jgi:hypothetical protein
MKCHGQKGNECSDCIGRTNLSHIFLDVGLLNSGVICNSTNSYASNSCSKLHIVWEINDMARKQGGINGVVSKKYSQSI